MSTRAVPFLALALSLVALVVALGRSATPGAARPALAREAEAPAEPQVAELRRQVARLREDLDGLAARRLGGTSPEQLREADAGEPRLAAFEARLAELERAAAATPPAAQERAPGSLMELLGRRGGPVDVAREQERATSPLSSDEEQVAALARLRGQRTADGADARDAEVVQAMVELTARTRDAELRADVFRQLHGVTDPALVGALLHALAHDDSAGVRSEAAETLDRYLGSPGVRAALEAAATGDPSADVRAQAAESLGGGERK